MGTANATTELSAQVGRVPWYQRISLPGGVTTPGRIDTQRALERIPFPETLEGKRALDIGTQDGFWAFEMERRGAAEVVATDVADWMKGDRPLLARENPPPETSNGEPTAFEIAHRALGSKVERREISIYDLSPEAIGEFDFVFLGSILIHLRDPIGAMAAARTVTKGELLVNDGISFPLTMLRPGRPATRLVGSGGWWSVPNLAGLKRMVEAAGFEIEDSGGPYRLPLGRSTLGLDRSLHGVPNRGRLGRLPRYVFGLPHAWIRAVPRPG
jgi:tRNA (mo5U34)-methyltransferase